MEQHDLTFEQSEFIEKILFDIENEDWHNRYKLNRIQKVHLGMILRDNVYDEYDQKLLNRIGDWYGKRKSIRRSKQS